ncbi:hypothetical protein MARPO_0015s0112 [Marchantia polymorpha]|uniref:Uncharacterized protein n=1 Tax=Marchantia polymorpha TaxID=3197 RepID=A0A2R6XGU1_MARPO|nr:hypothetical protein MARPO_0015s0112 [Marchantia polymorpha]|eukprot:PTQ45314.1 hypothetical protein MARPO_0015s0112 [Marchantia polymorpha]
MRLRHSLSARGQGDGIHGEGMSSAVGRAPASNGALAVGLHADAIATLAAKPAGAPGAVNSAGSGPPLVDGHVMSCDMGDTGQPLRSPGAGWGWGWGVGENSEGLRRVQALGSAETAFFSSSALPPFIPGLALAIAQALAPAPATFLLHLASLWALRCCCVLPADVESGKSRRDGARERGSAPMIRLRSSPPPPPQRHRRDARAILGTSGNNRDATVAPAPLGLLKRPCPSAPRLPPLPCTAVRGSGSAVCLRRASAYAALPVSFLPVTSEPMRKSASRPAPLPACGASYRLARQWSACLSYMQAHNGPAASHRLSRVASPCDQTDHQRSPLCPMNYILSVPETSDLPGRRLAAAARPVPSRAVVERSGNRAIGASRARGIPAAGRLTPLPACLPAAFSVVVCGWLAGWQV